MPDSPVKAGILRTAVTAYMKTAYPDGAIPPAVQQRLACLEPLNSEAMVPEKCFELTICSGKQVYVLRLGQPLYPHMKLLIESCPGGGYVFRADAHDAHLHAPPGSPDAAPLAALRTRNQELTEAIEAAWTLQGIPTFRSYLRQELQRRKCQ